MSDSSQSGEPASKPVKIVPGVNKLWEKALVFMGDKEEVTFRELAAYLKEMQAGRLRNRNGRGTCLVRRLIHAGLLKEDGSGNVVKTHIAYYVPDEPRNLGKGGDLDEAREKKEKKKCFSMFLCRRRILTVKMTGKPETKGAVNVFTHKARGWYCPSCV